MKNPFRRSVAVYIVVTFFAGAALRVNLTLICGQIRKSPLISRIKRGFKRTVWRIMYEKSIAAIALSLAAAHCSFFIHLSSCALHPARNSIEAWTL
jgi:hypothetical protein